MRILQLFLAASALLAAPVVVHTAWAECEPEEITTLPVDEDSVEAHCRELASCADEPFEHQDCVDWYLDSLNEEIDAEDDEGVTVVDLDCYDSDDYLADPTVCDPVCGDGVCSGGEDALSCPEDCAVCGGGGPQPPADDDPDPYLDPLWPSNTF